LVEPDSLIEDSIIAGRLISSAMRTDFSAGELRQLAKRAEDAD
jgi:hypothetical protein